MFPFSSSLTPLVLILNLFEIDQAPTRKMYIQVGIVPSVEITGGPWFTDNELDTEFIKELKKLASKFLELRVSLLIPSF